MAQPEAKLVTLVGDGGYGVMRGIQAKYFGGRQYFNELHTPNFEQLAAAMGLPYYCIKSADECAAVMSEAVGSKGPALVEVDMASMGELKFSGPPQKKLY